MPHAPAHTPVPKPNTDFESKALHLKAASVAHSGGSGGSILRTVIALVIVIAVIYGLTWVVRKLKAKDMPSAGGADGLERVASLALGTNRSVALVRVGSELHLIGVAEHNVTGIRRFSEDEAIELGLPVTPPGSVITPRSDAAQSFGDRFDSFRRMTQR
jgi:flagellar protein FliO/FliZ